MVLGNSNLCLNVQPRPSCREAKRLLELSKTKYLRRLEDLSRRQASLQKKLRSEHRSIEALNQIEEQVHARGWLTATGQQPAATSPRKLPPLVSNNLNSEVCLACGTQPYNSEEMSLVEQLHLTQKPQFIQQAIAKQYFDEGRVVNVDLSVPKNHCRDEQLQRNNCQEDFKVRRDGRSRKKKEVSVEKCEESCEGGKIARTRNDIEGMQSKRILENASRIASEETKSKEEANKKKNDHKHRTKKRSTERLYARKGGYREKAQESRAKDETHGDAGLESRATEMAEKSRAKADTHGVAGLGSRTTEMAEESRAEANMMSRATEMAEELVVEDNIHFDSVFMSCEFLRQRVVEIDSQFVLLCHCQSASTIDLSGSLNRLGNLQPGDFICTLDIPDLDKNSFCSFSLDSNPSAPFPRSLFGSLLAHIPFKRQYYLTSVYSEKASDPNVAQIIKTADLGDNVSTFAATAKFLGDYSLGIGEYHSAIRYYSSAIEFEPRGIAAAVCFANRASALCRLRDFGAAILDCEISAALEPLYAKAHSRLGFASYCAADYGRAVRALTRALSLDPTSIVSRKYLDLAQRRLIQSRLQVDCANASDAHIRSSAGSNPRPSNLVSIFLNRNSDHLLPPTEPICAQRLPDHTSLTQFQTDDEKPIVYDASSHATTPAQAARLEEPNGIDMRQVTNNTAFKFKKLKELHKCGVLSTVEYNEKFHRLQTCHTLH